MATHRVKKTQHELGENKNQIGEEQKNKQSENKKLRSGTRICSETKLPRYEMSVLFKQETLRDQLADTVSFHGDPRCGVNGQREAAAR